MSRTRDYPLYVDAPRSESHRELLGHRFKATDYWNVRPDRSKPGVLKLFSGFDLCKSGQKRPKAAIRPLHWTHRGVGHCRLPMADLREGLQGSARCRISCSRSHYSTRVRRQEGPVRKWVRLRDSILHVQHVSGAPYK